MRKNNIFLKYFFLILRLFLFRNFHESWESSGEISCLSSVWFCDRQSTVLPIFFSVWMKSKIEKKVSFSTATQLLNRLIENFIASYYFTQLSYWLLLTDQFKIKKIYRTSLNFSFRKSSLLVFTLTHNFKFRLKCARRKI